MMPRAGGGPALPLFDRLRARGTEALPDHGSVLRASIARELAALLNTRLSVPAEALEGRARSTLDYGLPDLTGFAPGRPDDLARLGACIEAAIASFEPRLTGVRVAALVPHGADGLAVEIAGRVGADDATFRLNLARHVARPDDA